MRIGVLKAGFGAAGIVLSGLMAGGAVPAAAASVPTITADMPAAVPAGHLWSFDDYFPRTLVVSTGTTIQLADEGFHTFTLLPHSVSVRQDLRHNGVGQNDGDDTTLNPNGTTHANFNVLGLLPSPAGCGSTADPCAFDGKSIVSEGDPLGAPSGPVSIKVSAKPGLYTFHCRIHPDMVGHLLVVSRHAHVPSPAHVQQQINDQLHKDIHQAKMAEAAADHANGFQNADGTTTWVMQAGAETPHGRVVVLEFLPAKSPHSLGRQGDLEGARSERTTHGHLPGGYRQ